VRSRTEVISRPAHAALFFAAKEMIMPVGANTKREREYKELKSSFKKEGRYRGREEEVAARIVNKQRAERGETKDSKRKH
jgi:hypothetical protein